MTFGDIEGAGYVLLQSDKLRSIDEHYLWWLNKVYGQVFYHFFNKYLEKYYWLNPFTGAPNPKGWPWHPWLFICTNRQNYGMPLTMPALKGAWQRALKRINMEDSGYGLHSLRHMYGYACANILEDVPIETTQMLMHHASITSTQIYYRLDSDTIRGTLTHDTSTLHQTTGYWSRETIFCNTSDDEVVLLHQPTLAELQLESTSFLEAVSSSVPFKSYFLQWIGKNYLGAFSLTKILNKNGGTWQHFQLNLRQKKYPKGRISRHMASLWWQHHKDLPHAAITQTTLHRLPRELSPLAIDWPFLVSGGVELFLNNLIQLSQVKIQPSKQAYPNYSKLKLSEKIHISIRNLAVEEQQLVQWALPFLSENTDEKQYYHGALCAIHAATAFLSWLRCKNIIVIPLNFKNGYQWLLDFGVWPGRLLKTPEAKDAIKAGLLKFIASSSTKHIDDIPADLPIIYGSNSFHPSFYRYLADWLRHPAIERKRQVFPIDHLQKSNLVRKNHKAKWTPSWIKDNCNQDWYDFAMLWWRHPANSSHKRNILKNLLEWAWEERSFESPWEITPEDLHDPHRSEHKKTYFRFLKQKQIEDKTSCWSGSSTMFRIVHQAALSPSSLVLYHGTLNNPFRTISNPFSNQRKKKHKTPRHSIPSTIHELMVDILLNPNEGIYSPSSWAKKVTQSDMVKVQDPEDPKKQISTWCPSRVTCLAMLLLSPFRKVQARWLDQGLMDDECYDFTTKRMCPNQHSLRNFTYPNKNTHHQQYGRNSGVLQYSTDSIHREETLCIFVNTNKTQLWDANRISGFEVPWPDGSDLINSDDPEQQDIGKWLSRLYRVLEYQIQWMQHYDPNPRLSKSPLYAGFLFPTFWISKSKNRLGVFCVAYTVYFRFPSLSDLYDGHEGKFV